MMLYINSSMFNIFHSLLWKEIRFSEEIVNLEHYKRVNAKGLAWKSRWLVYVKIFWFVNLEKIYAKKAVSRDIYIYKISGEKVSHRMDDSFLLKQVDSFFLSDKVWNAFFSKFKNSSLFHSSHNFIVLLFLYHFPFFCMFVLIFFRKKIVATLTPSSSVVPKQTDRLP